MQNMISQPLQREPLSRESPFSYTCNQCARCCYDKRIQVNPYEIARLAKNQDISTSELIDTYLDPGKPYLKNLSNGACVFLTEEGCGVHIDRPLVCRLYPLGQKRTGDGEESFHYAKPHPQTEGVYGKDGTVEEFLQEQGVDPYLKVRDRYVERLYRMLDLLADKVEKSEGAFSATTQGLHEDISIQYALKEWLDMDAVVARHCNAHQLDEPESLEDRLEMHLQAMDLWINTQINGGDHETHT